ncbi:putative adp-ribosylation factor gtpase-activating protein agd14, partial [Quercus suber]
MANRHKAKEEERLEKTIRGLLRYPGNRRCINCNRTTICLHNFLDICLHKLREFTHRVKSISMAKFNAEEVNALQAGGNERARQIYFKEWDPQRNSYPDGSNLHILRDFIKHVYLDRKYTGEKRIDKLSKLRLNDTEESNERSLGRSRSPRSEDRFKWHHHKRSSIGGRSEDGGFKYYYDERRSPRFARENSKQGGLTRTPARFEVVDDRFREDERGSRRFSSAESKLTITLPGFKKNVDGSRSPVVRPVGDILGDKVPPLNVGVISEQIDGKDANGSANNQNIASSSDQGSVGRNSAEHKRGNSGSLIDLIADSEPLDAATVPQTQLMLHTDNGGNFESPIKEKAPQASSSNSLESLLFELSAPSDTPARNNMSEGPSSVDALSIASGGDIPAGGVSLAASGQQMLALSSTNNMLAQPSDGGLPQAAPSGNSGSNINILDKEQLPNMQQYHPTASPVVGSGSVTQLASPPVGALNNQ